MRWAAGRARDKGAAALEFALVFPMLVVLVFGIVDFGALVNAHVTLANATRDAARAASLNATEAEIRSQATAGIASMSAADRSTAVISVTCTKTLGACSPYTQATSGDTSIVSIQVTHNWLFPLWPVPAVTITKTSQMRIE